jgi:glutathione S-transferase
MRQGVSGLPSIWMHRHRLAPAGLQALGPFRADQDVRVDASDLDPPAKFEPCVSHPGPPLMPCIQASRARRIGPTWSNGTREGIMTYGYAAIVTLLAIGMYFFFATRVAAARGKFGVQLPATTGNPDFERTYRAHINTLEWLPTFLVPLWLTAIYLDDRIAAGLGLVWIVGRILYFTGYRQAVEKRLPGFLVQAVTCLVLFFAAAWGIVSHIAHS